LTLCYHINSDEKLTNIAEMDQWRASCRVVVEKLEDIKQSQQALRQGQEELKQRQISLELAIKNSFLPLFGSYLSRIDDIYRHTIEYGPSEFEPFLKAYKRPTEHCDYSYASPSQQSSLALQHHQLTTLRLITPNLTASKPLSHTSYALSSRSLQPSRHSKP
jgi:hypothetical protein